jgi:hypothetical protein
MMSELEDIKRQLLELLERVKTLEAAARPKPITGPAHFGAPIQNPKPEIDL